MLKRLKLVNSQKPLQREFSHPMQMALWKEAAWARLQERRRALSLYPDWERLVVWSAERLSAELPAVPSSP